MKKLLMLSALALMTASVYGNSPEVGSASPAHPTAPAQKSPLPQPAPQDNKDKDEAVSEDEDVIIMEEDDNDPSYN